MKSTISWDIMLCSSLVEAIYSSKILVECQRTTQLYISEDSIVI
jgi:hypothetical protein